MKEFDYSSTKIKFGMCHCHTTDGVWDGCKFPVGVWEGDFGWFNGTLKGGEFGVVFGKGELIGPWDEGVQSSKTVGSRPIFVPVSIFHTKTSVKFQWL
jgi:hypothetical protein